jgi:c(7)-type cytochrome triheme protein
MTATTDTTLDCVDCHSQDKRARPTRIGHDKCFGACHGTFPAQRTARDRSRKTPYPVKSAQRSVCSRCHSPDALDRVEQGSTERLASAPPRRPDTVVSAPTPHAAHEKVKGDCLACHTTSGGTKGTPSHERCASCHASTSKPAMSQCADCHTGQGSREARPYSTLETFDHTRHAPRVTAKAEPCRTCHSPASIRPDKSTCTSCHDGAAAFSVVETACRRCHSRPSTPVPRPRNRTTRFSHETHEGLDRKLECTQCHQLDESGEPQSPGNRHAPCSDSGCHADDFATRKPAVCSACHVGTEPWLELYASVPPPPDTEFGSLYSHKSHSDRPNHLQVCTDCHRKNTPTRQLRLSRGHAACSREGCHTSTTAAAKIPLGSCKSCHVGNLIDERRQRQMQKKWSVRKKFSHEPHRTQTGETDKPLPCETCHDGIDSSDSIFAIPAPDKASCVRCHDGDQAFKLTGHGCSRCHDS